jgi:hypothetical protein
MNGFVGEERRQELRQDMASGTKSVAKVRRVSSFELAITQENQGKP